MVVPFERAEREGSEHRSGDAGGQSEILLEHTLSAMGDGLVIFDAEERLIRFNHQVGRLFALSPGEIETGMSLTDYLTRIGHVVGWPQDRIARIAENHRIWWREGTVRPLDHHFDDGTILHICFHPLGADYALLTYRDVTAEHAHAEAVRTLGRQSAMFREEIAGAVTAAKRVVEEAVSGSAAAGDAMDVLRAQTGEVAASAQQAATAMQEAARHSAGLTQMSEAAGGKALETRDAAVMAADTARAMHRHSEELAGQTGAIGDLTRLLTGVAGEIRMLALNAAIEAARSGESGRGFAVVAGEMKSLAVRIAETTGHIGPRLASLEAMAGTLAEGNAVVEAAIAGIQERAETATEISAEQAQRSQGIGAAIEETARGADQTAGAAQGIEAESLRVAERLSGVETQLGAIGELAAALHRASASFEAAAQEAASSASVQRRPQRGHEQGHKQGGASEAVRSARPVAGGERYF